LRQGCRDHWPIDEQPKESAYDAVFSMPAKLAARIKIAFASMMRTGATCLSVATRRLWTAREEALKALTINPHDLGSGQYWLT